MSSNAHWPMYPLRQRLLLFFCFRLVILPLNRKKLLVRGYVVKMSQAHVFTLVGDSNVRRYVNKASVRANPAMKTAQVLPCGHLAIFKSTLSQVRAESNLCIMACLTNFLTKAEGPEFVSQRIDPTLGEIREVLDEVCSANPDRIYLVSPPMYRTTPVWYREGLPEILTTFSQMMNQDKPANLILLPSFPTPAFGEDGVHLTPFSGLEFMMHLFDSSEEALASIDLPVEANAAKNSENTRVLEDRVMALEQDHRRLNKVVEDKIAIDAEAADFHANERMQDFFVVAGLKAISSDLMGKAWQDQAMKDVKEFIKLLMGKKMDVVYVKNATARHKNAEVAYNVQMRHVADSKAIRDKFGAYFVGGEHRPPHLKKFSVRNRVTPETKVRLAILQVIAKRYKTANPDAKVQAIGYETRPMLKITPGTGVADRRTRTYTFVDAVKAHPTNFGGEDLDFIMKKVNSRLQGQLRSLFIVLPDDVFKKRLSQQKKSTRPASEVQLASGSGHDAPGTSSESESESTEAEVAPPVPPPVAPTPGRSSGSGSRSRSAKRGATSSPGDGVPAKK